MAKYSRSKGPDKIDPLVDKIDPLVAIEPVAEIISEIINSSFSNGIRVARITPFFKQGDRQQMTNYRPALFRRTNGEGHRLLQRG